MKQYISEYVEVSSVVFEISSFPLTRHTPCDLSRQLLWG